MKMGISHQFFILYLVMSCSLVLGEEGGVLCKTPQYAEYGKTELINCEFEREFYAVYWYNSTNVATDLPILTLDASGKSGPGIVSREFDVHQNGSLVINEVTLEHDHSFTVIYVKTMASPIEVNVLVIVTKKPKTPHPSIDKCGQESRVCYAEIYEGSDVTCSVLNVRPSIDLFWVVRSATGDRNISSNTAVSDGPRFFSSQVTISKPFNQSHILQLLICKAVDLYELLEDDESVILVENRRINMSAIEPMAKLAFYSSKFSLQCVESDLSNIVWKRKMSDGAFHNVAVSFANEEIVEEEFKDSFEIGGQHSLVISDVKMEHQGLYACIYSGDRLEGTHTFEVSVAVLPEPRYPLVDGCDSQYCTKRTGTEGSLTCGIKGIRPKISLLWKVRYLESSPKINFKNQKQTAIISNDGYTYDVSLTSEYTITDVSQRRLTIECVVVEKEFESLEMWTIVDLLFQNGTSVTPTAGTLQPTKNSLTWMVVFIIPFILAICAVSYFVYRKKKLRNGNTVVRQSNLEKQETDQPEHEHDMQETEPFYHEIMPEDSYTETDGRQSTHEMEKLKELRKRLQEAPSLDDICQVPVLFITFLGITGEIDTMPKFYSVTTMFKYFISRFFDHKRSEISNQENQSDLLIESDHRKLDRFAFQGLLRHASKRTEIMWNKEDACKEIGEALYQECVDLGILVEAEGLYDDQLEVRFCNKLICDWYAAHYFSYRVSTYGREDAKKYIGVDPCEHHYFHRFSCGLHLAASEEVKKYFKKQPDGVGDRLVILYDLEETGNLDNTKQALKDLFKDFKFVEIRQEDSKLFRMSTLQLCEIAHSLEISIPPLWITECFIDVDIQNGYIKLKNGLTLKLEIFKEVRIEEEKKALTEQKVCQVLELATKSETLEKIVFWRSLVPESLQENKDLLALLQEAQVKVQWLSKPGELYDLNFQTGHWEMYGGQEVTEEKYAQEVNGFRATGHYNQ